VNQHLTQSLHGFLVEPLFLNSFSHKGNPMGTRNFGMGSRDMAWAGDIALKTKSGLSFSGIATVSERWGDFCKWAQAEGIKKMENVTRETVINYGNRLAGRVALGELSAATAQNYVSAAQPGHGDRPWRQRGIRLADTGLRHPETQRNRHGEPRHWRKRTRGYPKAGSRRVWAP
jgi:hypothetical protein